MDSKIKVIFLDIDGVLNTEDGLRSLSNGFSDFDKCRDHYGDLFCPKATDNLKTIIEKTGAKIVISSTWRANGIISLREMWKKRKLPGEIIDITPFSDDRIRGKEINDWLRKKGFYHPIEDWDVPAWNEARKSCNILTYVIIDDDKDFFVDQVPHFVHTPPKEGLANEEKMNEIIEILNGKL